MSKLALSIENINYGFIDGSRKRKILNDLSVDFEKGKFYTILGPTGSGKSTLLALVCALDEPETGVIKLFGNDIKKIGYSDYRRKYISIIFQKFNLIEYLNGIENVAESLYQNGVKKTEAMAQAEKMLSRVGISKTKAVRKVTTLSGGEQQRVAIARALAKDTQVIFGDEPTGSLDRETEQGIIKLFKQLADEYGKTVILVTHSHDVAKESDVTLELSKGKLVEKKWKKS